MGKMCHVSNAESISPSGLQSALNSRQTYRDVLQILYYFTVIDLSLFHPQSTYQSLSYLVGTFNYFFNHGQIIS